MDVQQALASRKGKEEEVARKFREFISNKKLSQKTLKGLVVHLSDLKKSLGDKIDNIRDTILTVCKECLPEDEPEDNPPSPPEDTPPSSQQIEGNGKKVQEHPEDGGNGGNEQGKNDDAEEEGADGDGKKRRAPSRSTRRWTPLGFLILICQCGFDAVTTASDGRKRIMIMFIERYSGTLSPMIST